jgi:hypothetical protein
MLALSETRPHVRHFRDERMSVPMIGKEYLYTAQALLRVAKNITDQTIANRLMALAADYERRARIAVERFWGRCRRASCSGTAGMGA